MPTIPDLSLDDGLTIRASGLERGAVFVTSKLGNAAHRPDDARRAFDATLREPGSDYVSTWRTLEELMRDGRAQRHRVARSR